VSVSRIALLVEDDPDQRSLYSLMLRRRGWTTYEAATGAQADTLLNRVRPDVIVLDLMLPDGDGISLCRDWRADSARSSVPILVLTALTDPDTRIRALAAGADAFVSKPITPAVLTHQVEQLVGRA